jgi:hypothetical protein
MVNVWVKSPDTHSERRIEPHLTVEQLKVKLLDPPLVELKLNKLSYIAEQARADHWDPSRKPDHHPPRL